MSNSTCADVISDRALQFLQLYNRSVSFEENCYRVEGAIAGRTLVHVSYLFVSLTPHVGFRGLFDLITWNFSGWDFIPSAFCIFL